MLLIIKDGELMLITKQNPGGGPMLKGYPIREDPDTGVLGYLLGYAAGEPVLMRTIDTREIVNRFGWSLTEYEESLRKLKPKVPFRRKLANALNAWAERD